MHIIALGLAAFYTRNQRVSTITDGFLQILITTTGRGSLEEVIGKGSGTMGGQENISEELKETMIRFGELIEANSADDRRSEAQDSRLSTHEEPTGSPETLSHENGHADERASLASGVEMSEKPGEVAIRAGFGVAE